MKKQMVRLFFLLSLTVIFPLTAEGRIWRSQVGNAEIEAEFVSMNAEEMVTLQYPDGKLREIKLKNFSDADQTYVKGLAAGKAEWPRFHGKAGEGNLFPNEKGLLRQWPADGPKLLWEVKGLGQGYASVTISGDLLFTAGSFEKRAVVQARKLSDGELVWKQDCGEDWAGHFEYVRSTPALDGDRVYYLAGHGDLTCMNKKDGKKIWTLNILKDFEGEMNTWALAESPLIDGNLLICTPGGKKGMVVALDKMTGKTVWTSDPAAHKAAYASLVPITVNGLRMLLTFSEEEFLGFNADNGKKLFSYPRKTMYGVNATDAIYHDGQIFVSSGYGMESEMLKLTVSGKTASVEKLWSSRELDNQHGGVVRVGNFLYGACQNHNGGAWVCLDWKTGEAVWVDRTIRRGSVGYADGLLFLWSEGSQMGLAEEGLEECKITGNFRVPDGGGGASWAHPVICDGKMYLRHADTLYVYQVK